VTVSVHRPHDDGPEDWRAFLSARDRYLQALRDQSEIARLEAAFAAPAIVVSLDDRGEPGAVSGG
jgi:hypothetical protein